jgi:hypothetical protein
MPVKVEEKHTLGGHTLTEFKIDEQRECVRGKAGPYEIIVDYYGNALVNGRNERKDREWAAKYLEKRFWIAVVDGKEKWSWPVHMVQGELLFPKLSIVDEKLFRKARGKGEADMFLNFDGVKDALRLHEKGELRLAGRGNEGLARGRLEALKRIAKYEAEIREAAQLFGEVQKLKTHPEVLKLARERGVLDEKPILTEEKAQMLTAIDSVGKNVEKVTPRAVLDWMKRERGVEGGVGLADVIMVGMMLGQLEGEGYVEITKEKGRVLTEFGRKELENYRKKRDAYIA